MLFCQSIKFNVSSAQKKYIIKLYAKIYHSFLNFFLVNLVKRDFCFFFFWNYVFLKCYCPTQFVMISFRMSFKRSFEQIIVETKSNSICELTQCVPFAWPLIFAFLMYTEEYHMVCKAWQKKFFCTHLRTNMRNVPKLLHYNKLTYLDVFIDHKTYEYENESNLKNSLKQLVRLKSLFLSFQYTLDLSNSTYCETYSLPHNLHTLQLYGGSCNILWSMNLPKLETLVLYCNDVKEQDLSKLKYYPQLKYFQFIGNCFSKYAIHPWTIDLRLCMNLLHFKISEQSLKQLLLPQSLQKLQISLCKTGYGDVLSFSNQIYPNIYDLEIFEFTMNYSLDHIQRCFPGLTRLHVKPTIRQAQYDLHESIPSWMTALKNLKSILVE